MREQYTRTSHVNVASLSVLCSLLSVVGGLAASSQQRERRKREGCGVAASLPVLLPGADVSRIYDCFSSLSASIVNTHV